MNSDVKNIIEQTLSKMSLVKLEDIPNIELYMDQVTTFMDQHLHSLKRYDEDKTLTKTMINNYAKSELLPAPDKKKYSKDHMILLIFIYYYKNVLSINDTKKLISPATEKYFQKEDGYTLKDLYQLFINSEDSLFTSAIDSIEAKQNNVDRLFENVDVNDEEKEYLRLISFVTSLCFDMYIKKQIVESLIDTLDEPMSKEEKEKLLKQRKEQEKKNK